MSLDNWEERVLPELLYDEELKLKRVDGKDGSRNNYLTMAWSKKIHFGLFPIKIQQEIFLYLSEFLNVKLLKNNFIDIYNSLELKNWMFIQFSKWVESLDKKNVDRKESILFYISEFLANSIHDIISNSFGSNADNIRLRIKFNKKKKEFIITLRDDWDWINAI